MADIKLTTADTAGFIPQFWSNRALDVLRAQVVLANLVARDTDFTEAGWKGKSINFPYPGTFSAVDKVADTPVTPQVPTGSTVTLTLNKHKVVPFLIEDFARAQANMDLMDRYIGPAVIAIAEQFESDLWLTMAGAGNNQALLGTAGTALASSVIRSAVKGLDVAKAPQSERYLVMNSADKMALLADSALTNYFAFSQADSIRNGYVGELYGVETFWSNLQPQAYNVTALSTTTTFTYGGQTTGSLTWSTLTAAALQTALAGLTSVGAGNVAVQGPTGGPFNVVFATSLGGTLTGSSVTLAAATFDVAFHKNAIIFATRSLPANQGMYGVYSAVSTDPVSGLSIRFSAQYDVNNIGMRANLDILYGSTVLRPSQAVVIES